MWGEEGIAAVRGSNLRRINYLRGQDGVNDNIGGPVCRSDCGPHCIYNQTIGERAAFKTFLREVKIIQNL